MKENERKIKRIKDYRRGGETEFEVKKEELIELKEKKSKKEEMERKQQGEASKGRKGRKRERDV